MFLMWLATGSDHRADHVHRNINGGQSWSVGREIRTRFGDSLGHAFKDVQTSQACLLERGLHDRDSDALDLDVHLIGRDAVGRTGDLEVHVAQVILVAENIGEYRDLLAFLDQTLATPATGFFMGTPASMSAIEPQQTVAMEDEPLDSRISQTSRMV